MLLKLKREDSLSRQLGSAFWTTGFSISNQIGKLSELPILLQTRVQEYPANSQLAGNLQAIQEPKPVGIDQLRELPDEIGNLKPTVHVHACRNKKTKSQYECKKGGLNPRHS
mmetsp:Transcript_15409/g.38831  ORF Transcript_15409/g.38831 Transcript_15409/m.38831 type:complete len:112 (-) Transcript_15409:123-458(-)